MTQPILLFNRGNNLGKEGAAFLANGLKEMKNLSLLNLNLQ